jgi:hypothetical protein
MVRGLNLTADAQRLPEDPESYVFPEKSTDWDTRDGHKLPVLDGEHTKHKRDAQKIGKTMMPYGTVPKISDDLHANPPKREEASLFDPTHQRNGCKQSRCDGADGKRLCYACFSKKSRTVPCGFVVDLQTGSAEAVATERNDDRRLMTEQRERAARAAEVERKLEDAKKSAASRTAAFNWAAANTQRATTAPSGGRRQTQTDVMHARPQTARKTIRAKNRAVAEFQTGQAMACKVQKNRDEALQTAIEKQVMEVAEKQHQTVERNKLERKLAYQQWMKGELDKQMVEKDELASQAAYVDRMANPADVVHFEPAVDAVGFAFERRRAAEEALVANMDSETEKAQSVRDEREARKLDQLEMLRRAREASDSEARSKRVAIIKYTADVKRALGAGHAAKIDRDAEEAFHRALPDQLLVLEQTDRYDTVVPLPFNKCASPGGAGGDSCDDDCEGMFTGRSTHVLKGALMKGTGIVA